MPRARPAHIHRSRSRERRRNLGAPASPEERVPKSSRDHGFVRPRPAPRGSGREKRCFGRPVLNVSGTRSAPRRTERSRSLVSSGHGAEKISTDQRRPAEPRKSVSNDQRKPVGHAAEKHSIALLAHVGLPRCETGTAALRRPRAPWQLTGAVAAEGFAKVTLQCIVCAVIFADAELPELVRAVPTWWHGIARGSHCIVPLLHGLQRGDDDHQQIGAEGMRTGPAIDTM